MVPVFVVDMSLRLRYSWPRIIILCFLGSHFVGEKGKMVRFHRGPAAVTGDESRTMPLFLIVNGKAR